MGTGAKATVQWAVSRGGGVEYQIYTLQDLQETGKFIRKPPQYFLRGRNRKCTRKNVLFYFLNVAYKTDSEQFASDWRSYNVSQYKYSASRLKSTKFCSKR